MKIYQLFYTSCKKGLSSGAGFQTYSMSEGIKEEEREEIESHCSYIPPENINSHPTDEEIKELFPVSFSFFKLKNGKCCISKTVYKGRDYSGRFGNYFCHVLIIEEKELNFYPIEIYGSSIFRDGLSELEENAEEIIPLEILEELPKGEVATLENIEVFLKAMSSKKRTKSLNEFIDGIIDIKVNNKKIIFSDNKENLALWIAAATMVMPISIAKSLTFNTYIFDTLNKSEFICGSLKTGTRINFSERNNSYLYNLFDFEDMHTNEFNFKSKFSKQVSLGYTIVKDYRKTLIDFMNLFEYKEIDLDIDNCVNLLGLMNNGIDKLSEEETLKAIDFANEYGSITALEQVMIVLNEDTLRKIALKLNLNLAEVIFKFFFKIANVTDKKEYMDKAYGFLFNSLNSMVQTTQIKLEDIINLHNNIRDYNLGSIKNFIINSIDSKRIKDIIYLEECKVRQAQFYLCTILGDFIKAGVVEWNVFGNNGCFPEFIEKSLNILVYSKNNLKAVLDYVFSEKNYFVNLIMLSYKVALIKKQDETVITMFNDFLSALDIKQATEIRKAIIKNSLGNKFLINCFSYEIKNVEDKKVFLKNYCKVAFDNNKDYKLETFSLIMEEFLKYFNYNDFTLEDYLWIVKHIKAERPNKILEDSLCEKIIIGFQKIIPITIGGHSIQKLITDINDIKEWYFIKLKLDIGEIMLCVNQLYTSKITPNRFLTDTRAFKLQGIEENKYEEILMLMFKFLCPYLKDVRSHDRLKKIFFQEELWGIYFKVYIYVISDIFNNSINYKEQLKVSDKKNYEIYLEAVYFLFKSEELFTEVQMQDIKSYIIDDLIEVDKIELSNYNMYMYGIISNTSMPQKLKNIKTHWEEIYETLSDNKLKRKFINKLQSIYKR